MKLIDLRSDTVTYPTPDMREAMAHAKVGDDVYGEDPTINRLQEMAATLLGKEAALFVPSGTMGNLVSILAQCDRGDEVILGNLAHTFLYEAGSISAVGGIHPYPISNQPDGTLRLEDIKGAIRSDDPHFPITKLIALESTHNRCGGVSLSVEYVESVGQLAKEKHLKLHLDGARLFNAAVALNVDPAEMVNPFDSVTFCLSKGLCAPVGSIICGTKDFISRAHRIRKQLGGGMRQVGILAAAGIVAIEHMIDRIAEDHAQAKNLATGLMDLHGIVLDGGMPQTNMVYITLASDLPITGKEFRDQLSSYGILVGLVGSRRFRLVTHYWIDDAGVATALNTFRAVLDSIG
jgi:threonine aldolase